MICIKFHQKMKNLKNLNFVLLRFFQLKNKFFSKPFSSHGQHSFPLRRDVFNVEGSLNMLLLGFFSHQKIYKILRRQKKKNMQVMQQLATKMQLRSSLSESCERCHNHFGHNIYIAALKQTSHSNYCYNILHTDKLLRNVQSLYF